MTETNPGEEINWNKITNFKDFDCTNFLNDTQHSDAHEQQTMASE